MKRPFSLGLCLCGVLLSCGLSRALAADEVPLAKARRVPPAGVSVPQADRAELQAGVEQLGKEIAALEQSIKPEAEQRDLIPDVAIFYNAVRYALTYDEFFNVNEIPKARALLKHGMDRAKELREGTPSWPHASGLVVRGYVSKIDGSVQPYGLVVPESVVADPKEKRRLDIWYHGRGETLNEINFLAEHEKSPGQFTPADTIVLHPYGRYCNANRFAGEVDTFEAMDSVKKHYAIDDNRIVVRGFSMGGAACWMMATHHSGLWAAAAPGAGFSETAGFLKITDLSTIPWYQQKLWHLYDSTDRAINLTDCDTVAYSGELDGQKQAADAMLKAANEVGLKFDYVIGKGVKHKYTPEAIAEINAKVDKLAGYGRGEDMRPSIRLATYSLRHNTVGWLTIDGLKEHWTKAYVEGSFNICGGGITIKMENVESFTAWAQFDSPELPPRKTMPITIDGGKPMDFGPLDPKGRTRTTMHFHFADGKWQVGPSPDTGLHKRHGLQGPIDDAFMDSFIMVRPTGKPMDAKTGQWIAHEQAHAIDAWRKQFRGEARVKDDSAITEADIASSNLVLWGDPSSNAILAKIAGKLPIRWDAAGVHVGAKNYPAGSHVPVLIYPNPLNPRRYVVLNSGFTFREYDYENNARQTPKLPDWAIVNIDTPATAQSPGGIPAAGFFDESWQLKPEK